MKEFTYYENIFFPIVEKWMGASRFSRKKVCTFYPTKEEDV